MREGVLGPEPVFHPVRSDQQGGGSIGKTPSTTRSGPSDRSSRPGGGDAARCRSSRRAGEGGPRSRQRSATVRRQSAEPPILPRLGRTRTPAGLPGPARRSARCASRASSIAYRRIRQRRHREVARGGSSICSEVRRKALQPARPPPHPATRRSALRARLRASAE
jgi:hypothetical protein